MCAKCHGKRAKGADEEYPERLQRRVVGDGELARLIDKTMPYQHPEKINAEESLLVSTYIHDAFYSPIAQERNRPARIELSRLTVRQYQNAVSDLVGSFRKAGEIDPRRGLKAEYYKGRRFRPEDKVEERIDEQVNFDFGTRGQCRGRPRTTSSRSAGKGRSSRRRRATTSSSSAPSTPCGCGSTTLDQPLIDAWVKSGNDTEFKALDSLAGRADVSAAAGVLQGQAGGR